MLGKKKLNPKKSQEKNEKKTSTPPKFNIAPEKRWLEEYIPGPSKGCQMVAKECQFNIP